MQLKACHPPQILKSFNAAQLHLEMIMERGLAKQAGLVAYPMSHSTHRPSWGGGLWDLFVSICLTVTKIQEILLQISMKYENSTHVFL